jgi:drug/metabolite transporter (DMT)-like permease
MIPLMYVIVDRQFASITPAVLRDTAVLGLMSLILPLYFLQRSIASLGPDKTGILIGFTPMVIVGFELVFLKSVQVPDVVGAVILPVIIVGFALYERSAQRRI